MLPNTSTPADYGAPKTDYSYVIDPETELSATELTRMQLDLAALSMTAPRAWALCTVSGGVITLADHSAVWGDSVSVAPVAARSDAGKFTVTWPATVTDLNPTVADRVTYSVSLRTCSAVIHECPAAPALFIYPSCTSNVATIEVYAVSGSTPTDPNSFTVFVW